MSHTTESEREKYEKTWEIPQYRNVSPGEQIACRALEALQGVHSWVDLGCGSGRGGLALAASGAHVLLVDIAANARDEHVQCLPFLRACLWELPEIHADAVFCADVLEHIPTEHVPAVLAAAARIAPRAFYQIALFPDEWGGRTLHLTVKPEEWWREELGKHYRTVSGDVGNERLRRLVVTCER